MEKVPELMAELKQQLTDTLSSGRVYEYNISWSQNGGLKIIYTDQH